MSNTSLNFLKKAVIIIMISIWVALLFNIFKSGGSLKEQFPKCIFTTMSIFALLTLAIKAIEYYQKRL